MYYALCGRITPAGAGKTFHSVDAVIRTGITPAGAGKTGTCRLRKCARWDHPRRCGENRSWRKKSALPKGSPPQVRGKPSHNLCSQHAYGITPAGAGKTDAVEHFLQIFQDHPRRCGENRNPIQARPRNQGSPPQVRGKQ